MKETLTTCTEQRSALTQHPFPPVSQLPLNPFALSLRPRCFHFIVPKIASDIPNTLFDRRKLGSKIFQSRQNSKWKISTRLITPLYPLSLQSFPNLKMINQNHTPTYLTLIPQPSEIHLSISHTYPFPSERQLSQTSANVNRPVNEFNRVLGFYSRFCFFEVSS